MSHEATNWAFTVRDLTPLEFRVLVNLADCHNPANGCFPTQEWLAGRCEIARSSVNRALDALEQRGLLRRVARVHALTKKQVPTRYFLACEKDFQPQDVAARVPGSDTAFPDLTGEEDVELVVENAASRVPETGGSVSDSYGTLTCKEPSPPLAPQAEGDFDLLVQSWPPEQLGDVGRAAVAFDALSASDQAKATHLVQAFRKGMYGLGRGVPRLINYINDRLFAEFDGAPPVEAGRFKITPDRPEWEPWLVQIGKEHGKRGTKSIRKTGVFRPETRWPAERRAPARRPAQAERTAHG